ncbi:hypothetical protein CSUI_008157 [Cystoisospora suis]|uniref:Uncharacterized protein n=1 Tax=Cystoisospora suis TaxID=483139 RepID=A0A2C6KN26_9APIC|nr:hypothetical protein CSUI_008157 [Cystoisospora suis]
MTIRRFVYACVISVVGLSAKEASASGELEKSLQRPEILPLVPLLWKNEGLLFTDILLQKLLLPFGLASPYTNLFVTEAVRDLMNELDVIGGGSRRRLRGGRRLQESAEPPKQAIRSFTKSLHDVLGGNVFDLSFADQLIDQLPSSVSEQLASVTEAFGNDILKVLADADNPASVIVQQLVAPFEGDGIPFLMGGAGEFPEMPRTLQEVKSDAESQSVFIEQAASPVEENVSSIGENLEARRAVVDLAHEIGENFGVGEVYANLAGSFCDEFLIPAGIIKEVAPLFLKAKASLMEKGDFTAWNPVKLLIGAVELVQEEKGELVEVIKMAAEIGKALGAEKFYVSLAKSFFSTFLIPFKLDKTVTHMLLANKDALLKAAAVKAILLSKASTKTLAAAVLAPKALAALALKGSKFLNPFTSAGSLGLPLLFGSIKPLYPDAYMQILTEALQMGELLGKGLIYVFVSKAAVHAFFDPLGMTEIVAELISQKLKAPGHSFSGPARTVTIMGSEDSTPSVKSNYDALVDLGRQVGEAAGSPDTYATLMTFFLDAIIEPLGLTDALAEAIPEDVPIPSVANATVSDMIEDLVTAVYTSVM